MTPGNSWQTDSPQPQAHGSGNAAHRWARRAEGRAEGGGGQGDGPTDVGGGGAGGQQLPNAGHPGACAGGRGRRPGAGFVAGRRCARVFLKKTRGGGRGGPPRGSRGPTDFSPKMAKTREIAIKT